MSEENRSKDKDNFIFGVIKGNNHSSCLETLPNFNEGRWSKLEHNVFINEVLKLGISNWKKLEEKIKTRNNCQIRSHFQKYLKKICSKYKLTRTPNEIFLEEKKIHKISQVDIKIIHIFNSYRKGKEGLQKTNFATNKKRFAMIKFLKIKRPNQENELNINSDEFKMENCEKKEKIDSNETSKDSLKLNATENFSILGMSENIISINTYNQLNQIRKMNQHFIDMIKNETNYEFFLNLALFQNYLESMSFILSK